MGKGKEMAAWIRELRMKLRAGRAAELKAEVEVMGIFSPKLVACTRAAPNPNARWHDGMHEVGKTSHTDGRYTRYRCADCNAEWETAE